MLIFKRYLGVGAFDRRRRGMYPVIAAVLSMLLHGVVLMTLAGPQELRLDVEQRVLIELWPVMPPPDVVRPVQPPAKRPRTQELKESATRPKTLPHKPGSFDAASLARQSVPAANASRPANASAHVTIDDVAPRAGSERKPVILANESGQDSLKHGAEARFMHGLATEEFVEENYVGEYWLSKVGRVWIERNQNNDGLILHADQMNFHRPLHRFNRFIYVYGTHADQPFPVLGAVTFFSDGDRIHQFLWQHNGTTAYFPWRR